jgi:hypothetical protein
LSSFILIDVAKITSPQWGPGVGILAQNLSVEIDDDYCPSGRTSVGRLVAPKVVLNAFLERLAVPPLRLTITSTMPEGRTFECIAIAGYQPAMYFVAEDMQIIEELVMYLTPIPEPLTFAAFAAANRARCESPDGFDHALELWSLSDWFTATMGELGRAANVARKLNRIRDDNPDDLLDAGRLNAELRTGIGDTCIYLDLFAQSLGFSLEEAVVSAFDAKSAEIGYPHRIMSTPGKEA